jgi:opacity protein-like surface antigen
MRNHQVSYNVLFYPAGLGRNKTAFPYATIGVGGTFFTLSKKTVNEALDPNRGGLGKLRNENIFAFNAGGGVRFKLNEKYGIRLDMRDYITRAVRYQLPKVSDDPNATVFPVGGLFHQLEFSFAFTYYF